jgi:hypothetical protein
VGLVAHKGDIRNTYRSLVGNPEAKRPLGRREAVSTSETSVNFFKTTRRNIPEDGHLNIKMDLRETGLKGVDWIHLARDRNRWRALVNT